MSPAGSVDSAPVDRLRDRRAASYRLPPLDCGRRDPLDPHRGPYVPTLTECDAWAAAIAHLAAHGHDVGWCVPDGVAEQLAVPS